MAGTALLNDSGVDGGKHKGLGDGRGGSAEDDLGALGVGEDKDTTSRRPPSGCRRRSCAHTSAGQKTGLATAAGLADDQLEAPALDGLGCRQDITKSRRRPLTSCRGAIVKLALTMAPVPAKHGEVSATTVGLAEDDLEAPALDSPGTGRTRDGLGGGR